MKKNGRLFLFMVCCMLFFLQCTKEDNHTEEPDLWIPDVRLADTQWKLVGSVDSESNILTNISPTGCEQCYTLSFDTDTTATGYSASNRIEHRLREKSFVWSKLTELPETDDGDLFLEAIKAVSSYALTDAGELKFFYEKNGKKFYLLYKLTDKKQVDDHAIISKSYDESPCRWIDVAMDSVYIINSLEELQKRSSCGGWGINFDGYSILFASIRAPSNTMYRSSWVTQVADNRFQISVEMEMVDLIEIGYFTVYHTIPKIPLCSEFQIVLNIQEYQPEAQATPYYYYYKGKKQYFSLNTEYAFLSLKEQEIPFNIKQLNVTYTALRSDGSDRMQYQGQKGTNRFYTELRFEEKLSEEQYLEILADIKHKNEDVIISPYLMGEKGSGKIGLSNFFYVKLKETFDAGLLEKIASQTKCIIMEQDPYMPQWFILSITEQSELNAMGSAAFFYESGLFQVAEPDLMVSWQSTNVPDQGDQQQQLRNIYSHYQHFY